VSGMRIYGLSSGLDTELIIKQLMDLERAPIRKLQTRQGLVQVQKDVWKDINRRLVALDSKLIDLKLSGTYFSMKASSSQQGVFTAKATNAAIEASYEVKVLDLAQSHRVASTAGEVNFPLSGTFLINDIEINVENAASMTDIRNAINNTDNLEARAEVVDGRLILTHNLTGSENAFTFEHLGGDDILLELQIYDSIQGTPLYQELRAPLNARAEINGLIVERSTNVLKDVISGVEITLVGKSDTPGRLDISKDSARALNAVKTFIEQYNSVMDFVSGKLAANGDLRGDPTLIRIQGALRSVIFEKYVDGGALSNLLDVGISVNDEGGALSFSRSGKLVLNESTFLNVHQNNPEAVKDIFSGAGKFSDKLSTYVKSLVTNNTGLISSREKGLESTIKTFTGQIERYTQRLELREKQLNRQFTALERSLSQIQNQSNWLASQVNNLAGFDSLLR